MVEQATLDQIRTLVENNKIILFMKGTPDFPMCGFSGAAVDILKQLNVPFRAVNVLADESIRQGIKVFGNWPTIPQLYIDGQLVGGADIMRELFSNGELAKLIA